MCFTLNNAGLVDVAKKTAAIQCLCVKSHTSVSKDVLKLGQHNQFPNMLSDLIIELQQFITNKRSSMILKTCLTQREEETREETKNDGKTEATATGRSEEEEEDKVGLERLGECYFAFQKQKRELHRAFMVTLTCAQCPELRAAQY